MSLSGLDPNWVKEIHVHVKTKEICNEAIRINLDLLGIVPKCFEIQEIYDKVVERRSYTLKHVSDRYKTQEMFQKVVKRYLYALEFVPDWFVRQEMCDNMDKRMNKYVR